MERITGNGLWRREEGPRLEGMCEVRGGGSLRAGDGWEQSEEEKASLQRWRTSPVVPRRAGR